MPQARGTGSCIAAAKVCPDAADVAYTETSLIFELVRASTLAL